MRFRGSAILFLLAAVLAGYFFFIERPRQRAEDDAKQRASVLAEFEPDAVDRLTIERPQDVGATLEFAVSGTRWEMLAPVRDIADPSAVIRLLAAAASSQIHRDLGTQHDLEPYGLDDPVVVTASAADATVLTLLIGGYTVDRRFAYASRSPGGDVLLVPTTLRRYAAAAVEDFRGKRVATFDVSLVDSFAVSSPQSVMPWTRGTDGWFTQVGDYRILGDRTKVESVLKRLRGLRVMRFPPEGTESPGADYRVSVFRTPPSPAQHFEARPGPSGVVLGIRPDDRLVEVDSTIMEVFELTVDDLREKRLLRFDRSRVARVELATPDTLATIVRRGEGWTHANPGLGTMDARRVEAALGAAATLAFDRVLRERAQGDALGGEPTFRLAVYDGGGTLIDELLCRGAPSGATVMATSRSSGLVAEIDASKLRSLVERFHRIRHGR
jgi:hypothetical protein